MDAAPNATDPSCAEAMVRLPDELEGLNVRETNAQATAAWGRRPLHVSHPDASPPCPAVAGHRPAE